jgi:hypothetical protein
MLRMQGAYALTDGHPFVDALTFGCNMLERFYSDTQPKNIVDFYGIDADARLGADLPASGYDQPHRKGKFWRVKIKAMVAMLSDIIQARHVLDCLFGTARWWPRYAQHEIRVPSVDLSVGMLEETRAQLYQLPQDAIQSVTAVEQSIFDQNSARCQCGIDLVVCKRFLNWSDFAIVEKVARFVSANQAISGLCGIPANASWLQRAVNRGFFWLNDTQHAAGNRRKL